MNSSKAKSVALIGVTFALVFTFLLIETYAFSAWFGAFTPAALTLPLAIAFAVTGKKYNAFIGGTLLGVASFLLAVFIANPVFINPLISVLPRVFIGVVAFGVCALVKKFTDGSNNKFLSGVLPYSLAGVFGVLTNTVLVLLMCYFFTWSELSAVLATILSVNFLAEIIASVILVPVFAQVIEKYGYGKK